MSKRIILTILLSILLIGFILAPNIMRTMSPPHNSRRFDACADYLHMMKIVMPDYIADNNGIRPDSLDELENYLANSTQYDASIRNKFHQTVEICHKGKIKFIYCPEATGVEPLIVAFFDIPNGVIMYLDADYNIRAGRMCLWPKWDVSPSSSY